MKTVEQTVALIDKMGTDLTVVNAARVSFNKESEYTDDGTLFPRDEKLIGYLAKHNHWTTFGHCYLTLRIKCPIFVARQLGKHQVGLVWNEVSRRYVDDEPEFYFPKIWREKAENVKQGSSDKPVDLSSIENMECGTGCILFPHEAVEACLETYKALLEMGVCAEQARMVLPQNMMTEFYWSGSLAAFSRVCKLRLDPHTQQETREVAKMISDVCADNFPVSWKALQGE